jgi:outer membrane receptor for ferrienterochelin and colicin
VTTLNTWQTNWINRVNVHYDIIKNLAFDINYMRTDIVDTWNNNLRNTPKHKFSLIVQYNMPKRFTLWVRNYWQSETQWWNDAKLWTEPAVDGSSLYYTLPSIYTWDIGLGKKLFKEYLNMNLSVRNLFNANERYTQLGAQFDFRVVASISANIDGLFAKGAPKP